MASRPKKPIETTSSQLISPKDVLPNRLILLPIKEKPLFPGMFLPIGVTNEALYPSIEAAINHHQGHLGVVRLRRNSTPPVRSNEQLERTGCLVQIVKHASAPQGELQLLINVRTRVRPKKIIKTSPYLLAEVDYPKPPPTKSKDKELLAFVAALITKIKELIKLNSVFTEEFKLFIARYGNSSPEQLTDMVASMLGSASTKELQNILDTIEPKERIQKVLYSLHNEVEVLRVKEQINKKVKKEISKEQRKFFLREQLKAIKKELGLEKDEKEHDLESVENALKGKTLTEEAQKTLDTELEKLRLYDKRSPEYGVCKNYLDWITSLPWGVEAKDASSLVQVKRRLNADHYGLLEVKERLLEFIAVETLRRSTSGSILCLVGPPGVGKTSLGKSIAAAIKRPFYRFSVGGMRDEAEIKGHRRTYIGAMPGKIIQALKAVGVRNPVVMLDEIDKISSTYHTDPSSTLLEVLDPEQNKDFLDHYLDLRFDLSQILFITTANQLDPIPLPLLDRMEVIRIPGYLTEEKIRIAEKYLIPRNTTSHGLPKGLLTFSKEATQSLIEDHSREAGVRILEKNVQKVVRKTAKRFVMGQPLDGKPKGSAKSLVLTKAHLPSFLGHPLYNEDALYPEGTPGLVTGLAWTAMGGSTLLVEAVVVGKAPSRGKLKVTGQLGKVMGESSEIAWNTMRALGPKHGLPKGFFDDHEIHVHLPSGAVPKDGPSAGITIATCLYSLATGKPIPKNLAMTGELTLSGTILPVGGLQEKLTAARRRGKTSLVLPFANKQDLAELPTSLKKGLRIRYARHFGEVLRWLRNDASKPEPDAPNRKKPL